jgi:translation initiation factor 4E
MPQKGQNIKKVSSAQTSPALRPDERKGGSDVDSLQLSSAASSIASTPAGSPPASEKTVPASKMGSLSLGATESVGEGVELKEEAKGEAVKESVVDKNVAAKAKESTAEESKAVAVEKSPATSTTEEADSSKVEEGEVDGTLRYPLQSSWTMSFMLPSQQKQDYSNYQSQINTACTFACVEDFWRMFNNLRDPDRLPMRSDYYLFKQDIHPAWEDPANENGGKWVVEFNRSDREYVNQAWANLSMAAIGEAFTDSPDLCGIVVSVRKTKNRVALWTRTASDNAMQRRIGQQMKKFIDLRDCPELNYQSHNEAGGKLTTAYTKSSMTI